MSFDLNEAPATAEEAGVPLQTAVVMSQPHKPHSVATTYPPNLFQAGEGLQLRGRLNNNAFMHASSGSGFQPFERNKDSLNTEVPILAEVLDQSATGPESIKDLECKEAEEASFVVMPQESAIVLPQTQQPFQHVLPTYPSNLFQLGEGSQLQGMLNNNVFDASVRVLGAAEEVAVASGRMMRDLSAAARGGRRREERRRRTQQPEKE